MKTSSKVLWTTIVAIFIGLYITTRVQHQNEVNTNVLSSGASQHNKNIVGDGNMTNKTMALDNIQTINIIGNYKVIVNTSNEPNLAITTDDNVLPYIDINTTNNNLLVSTKDNAKIFPTQATLTVSIPNFTDINLVGRSSVQALDIHSNDFSVNTTGNNMIVLSGKTKHLDIKSVGKSNLQANDLIAQNVIINSMGNSEIAVHAAKSLVISMVGKGNIKYSGNPNINKNVLGEGTVNNS